MMHLGALNLSDLMISLCRGTLRSDFLQNGVQILDHIKKIRSIDDFLSFVFFPDFSLGVMA